MLNLEKMLMYISVIILIVMMVTNAYAGDSEVKMFEKITNYPDNMRYWDQQDQATHDLLKKYQPRIFVAHNSYRPLDFYNDYLPNCVMRSVKQGNKIIHEQVDKELLIKMCLNHDGYLDYQISGNQVLNSLEDGKLAKIYGRIYQANLPTGDKPRMLLFLKYSLVFPYSGLPAKIGFWQSIGSWLMGDAKAWHELDIHGSIHIILDAQNLEPLGVLLAQHNHHRVFWLDQDFKWPSDNHVKIGIAAFSNEPYLLPQGETPVEHRTVGNPIAIDYLFYRDNNAPLGSGHDLVYPVQSGALEVEVELACLALDDPLYISWMCLGDRKKILGIWDNWYLRGPPGIDFYTFPELKNLVELTAFWNLTLADERPFELIKENMTSFYDYDVEPVLNYQRGKLIDRIEKIKE